MGSLGEGSVAEERTQLGPGPNPVQGAAGDGADPALVLSSP